MDIDRGESRSGTLDSDLSHNSRGELKIKGQANARRSHRGDDVMQGDDVATKQELMKRENELKERALRNKVIRTRKASIGGIGATSG